MDKEMKKTLQEALDRLDAMTIDEFEERLRAAGADPVRLEKHKKYKYEPVFRGSYTSVSHSKPVHAKTNLNTSFFFLQDKCFYEAA